MQWCGGGPKKLVSYSPDVLVPILVFDSICQYWLSVCKWQNLVLHVSYWRWESPCFALSPFDHPTPQLWLASLCQMLHGGSLMCCWWTRHQGHLMNICQCWRTLKNTAEWMEPFWSPRLRYSQIWRNPTVKETNTECCIVVLMLGTAFCFVVFLTGSVYRGCEERDNLL